MESSCSSCLHNPQQFIRFNTILMSPQPQLLCYFKNYFLGKCFICHLLICVFIKNIYIDAILHHLWTTRINTTWQSFNDLVDLLHITPRTTWNSKVDMLHALKYLSWILNVNINLFNICEQKNDLHKSKYILKYQFQNTLVKLLRQSKDFPSINIVTFEKKYYLLITPNIFPTLINLPAVSSITFNNVKITSDHVLDILNNSLQTTFPFTIKIFTSYSFIKHNSRQLCTNMIGQYTDTNQSNQETLFLFVTPGLERNILYLHKLDNFKHPPFDQVKPFNLSPHTEGKKINLKNTNLPKAANQKVCICQHEETQEMTLPKKFNNLGNIIRY